MARLETPLQNLGLFRLAAGSHSHDRRETLQFAMPLFDTGRLGFVLRHVDLHLPRIDLTLATRPDLRRD